MRHGFPIAVPGLRVGLFGGSFDPAHAGHVMVAQQALRRFRLDRVWWLVSPGNPLKPQPPATLPDRIAGARALLDDPRMVVTGLEDALGTRLTVDTIAQLQLLYPGVRFVWLMGGDNLVQFHRWDRWREIAARVPIGVLARPGARLAARLSVTARTLAHARLPDAQVAGLADATPPAWAMVDIPMSDASSTALRERALRERARRHRGAGESGPQGRRA